MDEFGDFAVIAGGAAAALVGLLFVAVSIRAETIGRSVEVRSRVAGILTILLTILVAWLCVALPNPARWVLGVELIVVALAAGAAFIVLNVRAENSGDRTAIGRVLDRVNPNVTTAVLVALAGVALVFGLDAGLFLLALATIIGFVGGVIGAWLVLVRATD